MENVDEGGGDLNGYILRPEGLINAIIKGYVHGERYRGEPRVNYSQKIIIDVCCRSHQARKEAVLPRVVANQSWG